MKIVLYIHMILLLGICSIGSAEAQQRDTSSKTTIKEEKPPVEVVAVDNRIIVNNAPVGSKLEIYSVVGIKVVEIDMKKPSGEYPVHIAKGYYIIRIGETVQKVAIR